VLGRLRGLLRAGQPGGVDSAEGVYAAPWSTFELSDVRVIEHAPDSAIVTYLAEAQREGATPYRALMSTAYVRRDGRWRLVLHQQTPDPGRD
jgi:hypothetical protein